MKEKENELKESREGKKDQDIFETEEIRIEEMAGASMREGTGWFRLWPVWKEAE